MQLHLLSQMTGFDHFTVRCASIWIFQSAHVSGSLPSLLHSDLTAGNGTSTSEERQCLCSLLLPVQAECKRTWWGKGPLFHSASHKPPIKHPVSKRSPTPSSFHAIYSTHKRNTNWTKPCQSHFLSKGLCKQNQLAIMMCVVLSRQSFYFLCWNDCFPCDQPRLHPYNPLYRCEGGGVARFPYTHQKTQLSQSIAPSKQFDGCAVHLLQSASHHHDRLADQQFHNRQCERWLLWHALQPFSLPACAVVTVPLPNTPQNQIWAHVGEQARWVHRENAINTSKTSLWLRLQPSTLC